MVFINQSRKSMWVLLVVVTVMITWTSQATGSSSRDIRIFDPKSIYEVLKDHGLPEGLFPKGVTNFSIDEDGRFEVRLNQTCKAKLEDPFMFTERISGKLSFGQIGNMSGVQTKHLFVWLDVRGVRVDIPSSGIIYFNDDTIVTQLSLSVFETPPDCVADTLSRPDTQVDRALQYRRFSKNKSGSDVM